MMCGKTSMQMGITQRRKHEHCGTN